MTVKPSRRIVTPGESADLALTVRNDGWRIGSVYLVLRVVNPYDPARVLFDSHRSLAFGDRQAWRLMDLPPGQQATFFASWPVPSDTPSGVYYFEVSLWNVPTVMRDRRASLRFRDHCFARSGRIPGIEVVHHAQYPAAEGSPTKPIKAFISYSWDSVVHQEWVLALADELVKRGIHIIMDRRDLMAGEEITHFIERAIAGADVLLLVCTADYVRKANERTGGVGLETVVSTSVFLQARHTKAFIPILRDNENPPSQRLPTYLGSTLYVDMRQADWTERPLHELVRALLCRTRSGLVAGP